MTILVRLYVEQRDKTNITVDSIDKALKILGKEWKDIYTEVFADNIVYLFFIGTKNYLVIDNRVKKENEVRIRSVQHYLDLYKPNKE
mgnify:CR=1 FL=1